MAYEEAAYSCAFHANECLIAQHGGTLLPAQCREVYLHGIFHRVADLEEAILECIWIHNENTKPYIWGNQASGILEKVKRA